MNLKQYYGSRGTYLKEHKDYFSESQTKSDVNFIIKALKLNKKDRILDLACGHGRHIIELKRRGLNVEGLDNSAYLLDQAKKEAKKRGLSINLYLQDIHRLKLPCQYDKIFLFFSEFGALQVEKVLQRVTKTLKKGGLFLLDTDNIFRLVSYLAKHPRSPYSFAFTNLTLKEKNKAGPIIKYYVFPEIKKMLMSHRLWPVAVYGNYKGEKLTINSKRVIIVARKK